MGDVEAWNQSAGIAAAGEVGTMELLHIVTKAIPSKNLDVEVEFDTGECGVFNCAYLTKDAYWARLADPKFFNTAHAEYGTIVWSDNIDVAPETVWERAVLSKQ